MARRHPWLVASLAIHAVLAAGLYAAKPVRLERRDAQALRVQVDASLRRTGQREMGRELRRMQEIHDVLAASAGLPPRPDDQRNPPVPADPARRAEDLAKAIEQVRQRVRADDLAREQRIPVAEALRRVKAEAARHAPPPVATPRAPEAVVAQLAARAKAALVERRAQLAAQGMGKGPDQGTGRGDGQGHGRGQVGQGDGAALGAHAPAGSAGNGAPSWMRGLGGGGPGGSVARGERLDALMAGMELGSPTLITGGSLDMSSSGANDPRRFASYLAPPPVGNTGVRPARGRTVGAGGEGATRIFLDTWHVIGPFAGRGRDSQRTVYPPERGIDLDAVYLGKGGEPVRWTWHQEDGYPVVPRAHAENAVYYAYTEVNVERDMDLWVWIGADDDTKMWFNDSVVWISSLDADKPWYRQPYYLLHTRLTTLNLTEGQRRLHFHKGRNTILLKLYNKIELVFFSVVLTAG